MAIDFRCTLCDKPLRAKDDWEGKKIRCPKCQALLRIPPPVKTSRLTEEVVDIVPLEKGLRPGQVPKVGVPPQPGAVPVSPEAEPPPPAQEDGMIPFIDETAGASVAEKMAAVNVQPGTAGPTPAEGSLRPAGGPGKPPSVSRAHAPSQAPGKSKAAAPATKMCPRCRRPYPLTAKICVSCGIYIDDGSPVATTKKPGGFLRSLWRGRGDAH